jgi:hypothetical protein
VLILNTEGASQAAFRRAMLALGEALAERLQQEAVLVELQRGGVTIGGGFVTAPVRAASPARKRRSARRAKPRPRRPQ